MTMRLRTGGVGAVLVLCAMVALGILLVLGARLRQRTVIVTSEGTAPPSVARVDASMRTDSGFPRGLARPAPIAPGFQGCPPRGDGGDPQLNLLKNRADSSATYYPVTVEAIDSLPWPRSIERRRRDDWSLAARTQVGQWEGIPVSVEGYFAGAKQEGPESPNCHGADASFRDWHLWLSAAPGKDRSRSVVVETTPVVRASNPEWTLMSIRALAASGTRVRVSGWLMLDPEHPDQVGRTRGTIWEVHPITRIEVRTAAGWVPLRAGLVPTRTRRRRSR